MPNNGVTEDRKAKVTCGGNEKDSDDNVTFDTNKRLTVSGISPTTASPVLKGLVTITGTNFGTNKADVSVYITANGKDVYHLPV